MDCSVQNHGCRGGWPSKAFQYVKDQGGIDTETSYPYNGQDHSYCLFRNRSIGANVTGYVKLPGGSDKALMKALASVGPISVLVDSSQFQHYGGGKLTPGGTWLLLAWLGTFCQGE